MPTSFTFDSDGKAITLKMNAISDLTDLADFQDLDFKKI
jgi:hypothetical protein